MSINKSSENVKAIIIDFNTLGISEILNHGKTEEILSTLEKLNPKQVPELFCQLKKLTNHYSPKVRTAALTCLRHADKDLLVEIIKDSLRDEDKQVAKAARDLFHHQMPKAA